MYGVLVYSHDMVDMTYGLLSKYWPIIIIWTYK